jgi:hypothetical protein
MWLALIGFAFLIVFMAMFTSGNLNDLVGILTKPPEDLTVCDEKHLEENTTYIIQYYGSGVYIPIPIHGVKTVCDKSHTVHNPAYDQWVRMNGK